MTSYLLDTCTISDFFRGTGKVAEKLRQISPVETNISAVTVMEVLYGLNLNPGAKRKFSSAFESMCNSIQILPFDTNAADVAANLRAQMRKQGTPIGAWDLLIGATALSQNLVLVTSNTGEFERIAGLIVENWR